MDKCLGGVNMPKVQIYIKIIKKHKILHLDGGVSFLSWGGCNYITAWQKSRRKIAISEFTNLTYNCSDNARVMNVRVMNVRVATCNLL